MCYGCYDRKQADWFLKLSKRLRSAMSTSSTEDYHSYRGTGAYVTLYKSTQLMDVSYHDQRPHSPDVLSFPVDDIQHLRAIVFQIIKLGYRSLYWTISEEVEDECPLPPPGLERLNYYLASMSYWNRKCCTYRYLVTEVLSLLDRDTIQPDTSTVMLLAEIPTTDN